MTNRTAATRYARALFDVALSEKADLSTLEQELAGFNGLIKQHPTLEKVLLNPAVPAPRKRETVAVLAARVGLHPVLTKLLVLLAGRDRLVLLPDLLETYRARLLEHQKVVRADVTTATPLTADRAKAIERSLAQATGRTVALTTRVAPEMIGGLVARVGSTVYDASVTTQLEKMRQRLVIGS
jgi:F-type H+-transporting ATPase subunit delta